MQRNNDGLDLSCGTGDKEKIDKFGIQKSKFDRIRRHQMRAISKCEE